ncbi:hypothetical protein LWI28_010527 [Acer negundo]|uniref:Uncharacterized protein n=1 Tax=Acer negundo TaxID=4023 RepID=A0AAD5IE23_ACENE|nr:hypothetical protein LWI28_010527 [Acer negundo]
MKSVFLFQIGFYLSPESINNSNFKSSSPLAALSVSLTIRSPTFSVRNTTREKAWSGRKPAIDHFRIYGFIAYAHVLDEKRKKLDDKDQNCVFLGLYCGNGSFGGGAAAVASALGGGAAVAKEEIEEKKEETEESDDDMGFSLFD